VLLKNEIEASHTMIPYVKLLIIIVTLSLV